MTRRFDTSALTRRPAGADWRRFRAEAAAGEHGADLVAERWWQRGMDWWLGTRTRYRLTRFARANGLDLQPRPAIPRPAAAVFHSAPAQRQHLDRITVPGPYGFVIGNYEEVFEGPGEATGYDAGYLIVPLRESYPPSWVSRQEHGRPRRLRDVDPVPIAAGCCLWSRKPEFPLLQRLLSDGLVEKALAISGGATVEVVGNELFVVLGGGHFRLTSPRLWGQVEDVVATVAPFHAQQTGAGTGINAVSRR